MESNMISLTNFSSLFAVTIEDVLVERAIIYEDWRQTIISIKKSSLLEQNQRTENRPTLLSKKGCSLNSVA